MSGGFFRGTSADQDTRFSNKQAKLLKTQKFSPELEHLVDMTRVKMDVMKPWIARRVTELLGFEDEVLINFVYGLLDGKAVDGKKIQIQLTGFMEKNTGKFMRELWGLLLSAQQNASGVPQQFLDEKEEEMRKKKVESDRISQEIQKKKEREEQEPEYVKQKRLDGEADVTGHVDAASDAGLKHSVRRASSANPEEERELDGRHNSRRMSRRHSSSPHSDDRSPVFQRSTRTKSSSRSFSNSRSYSEDGHKSRSISVSVSPPRHSPSQDRKRRSSPRHSVSPHRRRSPQIPHSLRQRSPLLRRRSSSRSHHRSPSPRRRRSPIRVRRRSPSPMARRSPSPLRRRSPSPSTLRRRLPSPLRRRSPLRPRHQSPLRRFRRSPSPSWHRSPLRRRSPVKLHRRSPSPARNRSPPRRRSQSPVRRRSPSPLRVRRSPLHSPKQRAVDLQSSPQERNRNHESHRTQSPYQSHRNFCRDRNDHGDGVEYGRARWKRSPVHSFEKDKNEHSDLRRNRLDSLSEEQDIRSTPVVSVPLETHAKKSHSPSRALDMNKSENRVHSSSKSPARQTRGHMARHNSPGASGGENSNAREGSRQKVSSSRKKSRYSEESSPEELSVKNSVHARDNQAEMKLMGLHEQRRNMEHPERCSQQGSHVSEEVEYGPGRADGNFSRVGIDNQRSSIKQHSRGSFSPDERPRKEKNLLENSYLKEDPHTDYRKRPHLEDNLSYGEKSRKKLDKSHQIALVDTDSEDNKLYRSPKTEKRSRKSEHKETSPEDEVGYDSATDRRKEAKRRKKEEKRLRKEEKRRKREERHRKREERRAQKKAKYMDTVAPPPDFERNNNGSEDTDEDDTGLRVSKTSDTEETESEQKKLEIELRNKALESLRAKKAISH
uniref:Serine/arginine repetitive matrix protein 1 n=1 Tax=Anthurium amnicola TaxID=1678845 RepID=A0A1D1YDA5_9ARAE